MIRLGAATATLATVVLAQTGIIATNPVTIESLLQGIALVMLVWVGRTTQKSREDLLEIKRDLYGETGVFSAVREFRGWKDEHSVASARALERLDLLWKETNGSSVSSSQAQLPQPNHHAREHK